MIIHREQSLLLHSQIETNMKPGLFILNMNLWSWLLSQ